MKLIKLRCVDTLWWFTSGGPHLQNCFVKACPAPSRPPYQNKQCIAFVFVPTSEGLHDVSSSSKSKAVRLYYWGATVCGTSTGCETYISSPSPPHRFGQLPTQIHDVIRETRRLRTMLWHTGPSCGSGMTSSFKTHFNKKYFISLHWAINWATFISKRTAIPLGLDRLYLLQQFKNHF